MLEHLSLSELEAEATRVDNELKRVYCSRSEAQGRNEKIAQLAAIRREVKDGIKAFRQLKLGQILQIRG